MNSSSPITDAKTMSHEIKVGAIVRLKAPYKPTFSLEEHFVLIVGSDYRNWQGFTHGIVVEILSHTHVSLHVYDPARGLLYMLPKPKINPTPVYVDFHINELELIRNSDEEGYRINEKN